MTTYQIRRELNNQITYKFVQTEEYQDRFYFVKLVSAILPDLPSTKISRAVEMCNNETTLPRKRKLYLRKLSNILSNKT